MTSPTHEEKRQIFQRHFLLGKLSPNEIDALISYARVERYTTGREIFAKGSPGQCLMAVLRGSVKISSLSVGGKEIVFAIFNAGDIFGEIAVLDGEERSADATAMSDCELLVLNRRDFLPVHENHADLCMILLRILCRGLRQTTEISPRLFRRAKTLSCWPSTSTNIRPERLKSTLFQWLAVPLWVPTGKDSVPTDFGHSVRVLLDPAARLELGARWVNS